MKHTIRVVLQEHKKNSKGLCPVKICVSVNSQRTYVSTGVRVPADQWDGSRVRSSYPHATLLNAKITRALHKAEADILQDEAMGKVVTAKSARRKITGEDSDFIAFCLSRLDTLKKKDSDKPVAANTKKVWTEQLGKLSRFAGGSLPFSKLTPEYLSKYRQYVAKDAKGNTVRCAFIPIRRFCNIALEEGVLDANSYPFRGWKFPKEMDTDQVYLTEDELKLLTDALNKPMADYLRNTLAHFLLECFSGLRFSDWGKWQTERLKDSDNLYLNTTKTGERIYIPLSEWPQLRGVIEFIRTNKLKWNATNDTANGHLLEIAQLVGIKKHITTHSGRHSAATQLLERGFSMEAVAAVLGVSMDIVQRYAKLTGRKIKLESLRHGGL